LGFMPAPLFPVSPVAGASLIPNLWRLDEIPAN
jgi:hypothetical protein